MGAKKSAGKATGFTAKVGAARPPNAEELIQSFLSGDSAEARALRRRAFAVALLDKRILDRARDDDELFAALIDEALAVYEVKQARLAVRLGASTAQVGRWRKQQSAPAKHARANILYQIGAMILHEQKLDPESVLSRADAFPDRVAKQAELERAREQREVVTTEEDWD